MNFDLTCNDSNVQGPGVDVARCQVTDDDGNPVSDAVPVAVSALQVIEFDRNLAIVANATLEGGPYFSGDEFIYDSIVNDPSNDVVPKGLVILFNGTNLNEEVILNTLNIVYTNDCDVYPVLEDGQTIGWIEFVCTVSSLVRLLW